MPEEKPSKLYFISIEYKDGTQRHYQVEMTIKKRRAHVKALFKIPTVRSIGIRIG